MTVRRAAVVAVGAACLIGANGVLAACARDYEPLEVGQCLPPGAEVIGRRAQAPELVPCSQPHQYEVYARRNLDPPEDGWPGEDLVTLNAKRLCGLSVRGAARIDPGNLPDGVKVVHIAPSESSWRKGDREVECLFRWDDVTTSTLVAVD